MFSKEPWSVAARFHEVLGVKFGPSVIWRWNRRQRRSDRERRTWPTARRKRTPRVAAEPSARSPCFRWC